MFIAFCANKRQRIAGLFLIGLLMSRAGFGVRIKKHVHPVVDDRDPCEHVSLHEPTSSQAGHLRFANANESVEINIQDEGAHDWNIQNPSGTSVVRLPSVYIDSVSVSCVAKGMCKDMTTVAINHWRFEAKGFQGDTPFAVSLAFAADPPVAGCICYMEALMAGHTRTHLYVKTKPTSFTIHEGFDAQGKDIPWQSDDFAIRHLKGTSLTIAEAAEACVHYVPGCRGFSLAQIPSQDPEVRLSVEEYHFKSSMSLEVNLLDTVTSVRVSEGPGFPYELQYAPKDGRHWHREWCIQQFENKVSWPRFSASRSRLQGKVWLFL